MDQPLPEWVTKDFFAKCLRKEKSNEDIIVTNFIVSAAVPPGNNYGSFIFRVNVEYQNGAKEPETYSLSLIIKAELTHGNLKEMVSEFQLNEPSFYYKFIPAAKKFSDVSFAPRSFYSPKPNVTILEDLKEKGFLMADRAKQLDFDHCRLYVTAAASFHALSVRVYKENPELLEPIKNLDVYTDTSKLKEPFQAMIKFGMKCLADATEGVARYKKYSELIRDSIPKLWDLVVEANKQSDFLNTIRQGDPWTTNMMFKYGEEGDVCDIKIIDFQGTTYGSPINDLVFFIWSSANNDVKKNRLKELYKIYLDSLNENLERFNCKERLNNQQLQKEVERNVSMILWTVGNLPGLLASEPMDIDEIFSKDIDDIKVENFFKKYYTENYCNNYLPQLLECLEINSIFNFLESKRT